MLKKRIKKWDLDRKHKQADMLYAVKIALEREAQGKKTAFVIRGRVVAFEEVQHYFRRKGVRDLRALVNDLETVESTTRIECHTPKPPGLDSDYANQLIPGSGLATESFPNHLQQSCSNSEVIVIPDPNQVARTIQQSTELKKLDQLLHHGRNYYNSFFETRDFARLQNSFAVRPLEEFYHNLFDGEECLEASMVHSAFAFFDYAFNLIKKILEKEALLLLPYLYHMLLPGRGIRHQPVLRKLLDFISEMIQTRFPHLRPVSDSLVILNKMSVKERGNCSVRVLHSLLDRLATALDDDLPRELRSELEPVPRGCWRLRKSRFHPSHSSYPPIDSFPPAGDLEFRRTTFAVWILSREAELIGKNNGHDHSIDHSEDNQLPPKYDEWEIESVYDHECTQCRARSELMDQFHRLQEPDKLATSGSQLHDFELL